MPEAVRTSRKWRPLIAAPLAMLPLLAGCHIGGLDASSSCKDYLKASGSDQVRVVEKLYHAAHPEQPEAGPASANAVFNVGYECQSNPSLKLGQLGDFRS